MSGSTVHSSNKTTQFQKAFRKEYVREGPFGALVGNTEAHVIQTNRSLKQISIPLVGKVGGAGVTGSATLSGNERALANFGQISTPTYYRQAVTVDNEENEKGEFDLFQAAKPALGEWTMELVRDQIIQALGAIEAGGTYYNYGGTGGATNATAASAANMDTWAAANEDRIVYGAATSNFSSGNHTTALGTLDNTADKVTAANISFWRRKAELARPKIRPYKMKNGKAFYVLFLGAYSFRDAKIDTTISQANREARPRDVMDNPIFNAGDLFYDGVVIKEVSDMDVFIDAGDTDSAYNGVWGASATGDSLLTAGALGIRTSVGFLCGAQAVTFVIGRNAEFKRKKEDDYDFNAGIGVQLKHDIRKTFYNAKQHGMVTCFHAALADS